MESSGNAKPVMLGFYCSAEGGETKPAVKVPLLGCFVGVHFLRTFMDYRM